MKRVKAPQLKTEDLSAKPRSSEGSLSSINSSREQEQIEQKEEETVEINTTEIVKEEVLEQESFSGRTRSESNPFWEEQEDQQEQQEKEQCENPFLSDVEEETCLAPSPLLVRSGGGDRMSCILPDLPDDDDFSGIFSRLEKEQSLPALVEEEEEELPPPPPDPCQEQGLPPVPDLPPPPP